MSLESKIELLTAAIDRLTAMLEKQPQPVKSEAPIAKLEVSTPEVGAITIESLQALCMEKVRKDRANTAKVKEILGGRLVKVIPTSEYASVKVALEAL